jgi:hypothetical protein
MLLFGAGLVPWSTTVTPAVRVQVLKPNGEPSSNTPVAQEWWHSSYGDAGSQRLVTDGSGYIELPERRVSAGALARFVGGVWVNFTSQTYGPYGKITAELVEPRMRGSIECDIVICDQKQIKLSMEFGPTSR